MKTGLILCLLVAGILMLCIIIILLQYRKLKNSYDALSESYQNLEKLNRVLRMQRHDFLNHLQVVYGMMELEEYEELKKYLDPLYQDLQKTGKAIKTAKPGVNALMYAKSGEAKKNKVEMYLEVKSDLKELSIPDWEICKVLSNIIDNAITALLGQEEEKERKLWINLTETKEAYQFEIVNNGPQIDPSFQKVMFQQGVTTKKEEGHGMGLAIVNEVVKQYGGSIEVVSKDEETRFSLRFEKKMEGK